MMHTFKRRRLKKVYRYIFVCLLMIGVVVSIRWLWIHNDPNQKYTQVEMDNKLVGECQSIVEETDHNKSFLHYPKFDREDIDTAIAQWRDKLPKDEGITYVDYDSRESFGYDNITFHVRLLDTEENLLQSYDDHFTFDKESGKLLTIADILRRDYGNMLKEQFQKQAKVKLTDLDSVHFSLTDTELIVYADQTQISLPYDAFAPYMNIPEKGIAQTTVKGKKQVNLDPTKKMIALTFDDGPSPYTEDFLKLLESHQANATFFVLGQNVKKYPETIQHMVESGFEVGNHSWDHQSLSSDDRAKIKREIFDTQDEIYRITGTEPTRIRPPYGAWNDLTKNVVDDNGMHITLWNVDSEDWRNRDDCITLSRAKAGARDGAIMLFHDLYPSTLKALESLIPYLQKEGYQLVTVSELFQYKGDQTGF